MSRNSTTPRDTCLTVEPFLSSYAAGALDEAAEGRVRDHLAACADCRAALAESDPSVLFLELRRTPLPDHFWAGFGAGLRRRLEAEGRWRLPRIDWAAASGVRRLAYVVAPLVMVALLGTVFLVRPGGPGFRGLGQQGPGVPMPPPLPGPAAPLASAGPVWPPALEEVGSPSARVYTFNDDEGGSDTPIYFVVDESIDI